MKNGKLKRILMLAAAALLLTFTVSGTLAYLATSTNDVTNVFTPVKVDTEIVEKIEIENNAKTSIQIENVNASDNIPVYVRAYLVGNWCDEKGRVVLPWNGQFTLNEDYWKECKSDGYYYYKKVLPVGKMTENLLKNSISATSTDADKAGLHLEITVVHQSIQSTPTSAVESAWGVTVANDGTISK